MMNIADPSVIKAVVANASGLDVGDDELAVVQHFGTSTEGNWFQSDTELESSTHRLNVELKLDSYFTIQQIRKYLVALACIASTHGHRKPRLLLVSRREMPAAWFSKERSLVGAGTGREILNAALAKGAFTDEEVRAWPGDQLTVGQVNQVAAEIEIAHITWDSVSAALRQVLSDPPSRADEKLVQGFLQDLDSRLGRPT